MAGPNDPAVRIWRYRVRRAAAVAGVTCFGLLACGSPQPVTIRMSRVFGPVIGNEVIVGRAESGSPSDPVLLLTAGCVLIEIDLARKQASRRPVLVPEGKACWGLARLNDGSLWTLEDRHTLAQIDAKGNVIDERPLEEPHVGLFGRGDRLLFQQADFTPPAPALLSGRPDDRGTARWSDLSTRPFDQLTRAATAALNLVACGHTETAERPCWFPNERVVALIDAAGATRRIALDDLQMVPPELLLTLDSPPVPIRDVYVDAAETLWVISSGTPTTPSDAPGGWLLARYRGTGQHMGLARLPEPVRLILRAEPSRAIVIGGRGDVLEVRP